jgi:subfamily B ATP-binding cassette protein MsbA
LSLVALFGASLIQTLFRAASAVSCPPKISLDNINEILKYWTYQLIKRDSPFDSLKVVCGLMAATFFLKNFLIYIKALVMAKLNLVIVRDMRNQLFNHVLRLPVTYYDRTKSGNIISLILNDVQSINASMTGTFDKIFVEPMRLIFFIASSYNKHQTDTGCFYNIPYPRLYDRGCRKSSPPQKQKIS